MAEASGAPSYERIDRKVEVMDTPYDRWASSQGIDVIRGFFVDGSVYNTAQMVGSGRRLRRLHHVGWHRLSG